MSELIRQIGQRIRNYRVQKGFSQERLAELSGCHPTYIGQIERGEKNATLESIEKISSALKIPLSTLFEKLEPQNASQSIPLQCYELLLAQSKEEQEQSFSKRFRSLMHPYLTTSPMPSLIKCCGSVFSTSGSIRTIFGW